MPDSGSTSLPPASETVTGLGCESTTDDVVCDLASSCAKIFAMASSCADEKVLPSAPARLWSVCNSLVTRVGLLALVQPDGGVAVRGGTLGRSRRLNDLRRAFICRSISL